LDLTPAASPLDGSDATGSPSKSHVFFVRKPYVTGANKMDEVRSGPMKNEEQLSPEQRVRLEIRTLLVDGKLGVSPRQSDAYFAEGFEALRGLLTFQTDAPHI
jgi:hypothetical protein